MPRGTVEASQLLLDAFQNLVNPAETGVSQVEIREFMHGGQNVRGVGTLSKIPQGGNILTIPKEYTILAKDITEPRFQSSDAPSNDIMDEKTRLGLWLAEKKHELLDQSSRKLDTKERYWRDALNAYPTLDQYQSRGIPLTAPEEDLSRVSELPTIGSAGRWASKTRGRLAIAQAMYNGAIHKAPADGHEPMGWEDALWGRVLASTGSFGVQGMCGDGQVAPLADLVNHSDNFNATFECTDAGDLKINAVRDIQPGEEVTIAYKDQSPALFQFYGIVEHVGAPQYLDDTKCYAIRDAHLEDGTSPFLKNAAKFANAACAATPPRGEATATATPESAEDPKPLAVATPSLPVQEPAAGSPAAQAPAAEPAAVIPEATVAMPLPKIAIAAMNPLLALLQAFKLPVSKEFRVADGPGWWGSRSEGTKCPACKTDFI